MRARHWQRRAGGLSACPNRVQIEAKLRGGLTTPAPARRDTPEVPLNKRSDGTSDI